VELLTAPAPAASQPLERALIVLQVPVEEVQRNVRDRGRPRGACADLPFLNFPEWQ
jgi:hypothetical protein